MTNLYVIILALLTSFPIMSQTFTAQPVPAVVAKEMLDKGTISSDAPVPIERLRWIEVDYFDFNGNQKTGEIIVMDAVASSVSSIFKELFDRKFPLEKIELITQYDGNDEASMSDNNTSAHNFRKVARTTRLSLHAYGTAIDINPVQNPYILFEDGSNEVTFLPPNSVEFANRMLIRLGKETRKGFAEEVIDVFARHGFYWWGGYWDTPIDYQHFQLDRDVSYVLAAMDADEAEWFFLMLKNYFNEHQKPLEKILRQNANQDLIDQYQSNPDSFKAWVRDVY